MVADIPAAIRKVILVGNPNVGKFVIFRLLTGNYVMVSNFPGTTVEVSRGRLQIGGSIYEIVDTPGVNSLIPQSEDERVACEIILREKPDIIVQVADAKNLRRTLLITLITQPGTGIQISRIKNRRAVTVLKSARPNQDHIDKIGEYLVNINQKQRNSGQATA